MNPNWLGVISVILAFIGFFVAYRSARGSSVKARRLLAALAVVLAIPGASFAAYYVHVCSEPSWYYQFRSIPGTELLIAFLGVAGGLTASLLPRAILMVPLLGVGAFSIAPFVKPFVGPLSAEALNDKWDGEICLQSTPSTCGAASVATILKHLESNASESQLAAEAHSYAGGTEAWYLARAARVRGFDVRFDFASGFSPEGSLPAVVGVRLGSIGHFIPILGREGEKFVVGDPLRGRELLSWQELEQRYDFTGFHMRITGKRKHGADDKPPEATRPTSHP